MSKPVGDYKKVLKRLDGYLRYQSNQFKVSHLTPDDLLQEGRIEILKFNGRGVDDPVIKRAVKNRMVSLYRRANAKRRGSNKEVSLSMVSIDRKELLDYTNNPADLIEVADTIDWIRRSLYGKDAELFFDLISCDLPLAELAELHDWSYKTARRVLHRVRETVFHVFKSEFDTPLVVDIPVM